MLRWIVGWFGGDAGAALVRGLGSLFDDFLDRSLLLLRNGVFTLVAQGRCTVVMTRPAVHPGGRPVFLLPSACQASRRMH